MHATWGSRSWVQPVGVLQVGVPPDNRENRRVGETTTYGAPVGDRSDAARLGGLLVDWGGVLTSDLRDAAREWCSGEGIDYEQYVQAIREWLGPEYAAEARTNPVHALERGEMEVAHFEERLASRLRRIDGSLLEPAGLLGRMFACFTHEPQMSSVVRRVRAAGVRTGLLSNSWGNEYPREEWTDMFDAVVISGEVGMRKPEPGIFRLAADRVGLDPSDCVFVDDVALNVRAAVAVGMVGVHHSSVPSTVAELEALFDVSLAG